MYIKFQNLGVKTLQRKKRKSINKNTENVARYTNLERTGLTKLENAIFCDSSSKYIRHFFFFVFHIFEGAKKKDDTLHGNDNSQKEGTDGTLKHTSETPKSKRPNFVPLLSHFGIQIQRQEWRQKYCKKAVISKQRRIPPLFSRCHWEPGEGNEV